MSSHLEQHVLTASLLRGFANENNQIGVWLKKDGKVWPVYPANEARIKKLVGVDEKERTNIETEVFKPIEDRLSDVLKAIEGRVFFLDQELVHDALRILALHLVRSDSVYRLWMRLKKADPLLSSLPDDEEGLLRTRTDFVIKMLNTITEELIADGALQIGIAEPPHSFVIADTGPLLVDDTNKRVGILNGVGFKSATTLILTLSPYCIVGVCTGAQKPEGGTYITLGQRGIENYNGLQRIQAVEKVYFKL